MRGRAGRAAGRRGGGQVHAGRVHDGRGRGGDDGGRGAPMPGRGRGIGRGGRGGRGVPEVGFLVYEEGPPMLIGPVVPPLLVLPAPHQVVLPYAAIQTCPLCDHVVLPKPEEISITSLGLP